MRPDTHNRMLLVIALAALLLLQLPSQAYAVRHPRIHDADIGEKGRVILEYGQDSYEETTDLAIGRDVATFFNFGYNLNERLQVRGKLMGNELSGVDVLFNPLFSNLSDADGWGVEVRMMLERTPPAIPATPESRFSPGNAFCVVLGFDSLALSAVNVDDDLHRFYGSLLYSTDFTQELHAHTVFTTQHYTSDTKRGNATSLGLGVDYDLYSWDESRSAVQLTANGLIDIYSIRKPTFDTGRVTRFDAGLRLRISDAFSGYAGYEVVNDSLSDRNSQGAFYGVAYTPKLPSFTRAHPPEEAIEETPPEETPPSQADVQPEETGDEGQTEPTPENGEAPVEQSQGKEASYAGNSPQQEDLVPPVVLRKTRPEHSVPSPPLAAPEQTAGPVPTTTARIARPPAIENPWELLPLGYDFHPLTATVRESVSGPDDPASGPRAASQRLKLAEGTSGTYRVFTNS